MVRGGSSNRVSSVLDIFGEKAKTTRTIKRTLSLVHFNERGGGLPTSGLLEIAFQLSLLPLGLGALKFTVLLPILFVFSVPVLHLNVLVH